MRKIILSLLAFFLLISCVSAYEVSQENFTTLLACGGDFIQLCPNAYDGDYGTYARFSAGGFDVNYTIPEYTQSAKIQVKFGSNFTNFTVPSECLENDGSLVLEYDGAESVGQEFSAFSVKCKKITGSYTTIYQIDEGGYMAYNYIFEEAVFWEIVEPVPSYQDTQLYQDLEGNGIGVAIFLQSISVPLLLLMIILTTVSIFFWIVVEVGYLIVDRIRNS